MSGKSRGSSPTWLCWSSAHLGPDEPNMVQARMLNYSLNWTARSSAIQRWQSCQCCSSLTRRWPSRSRAPFGLRYVGHGLLVNVAAHPAEIGLKSAKAWSLKIRGEVGRTQAEARALLDYAGHRPTLCNVGLMSLTRLGPKSGSRHVFLIIA